MDHTERPSFGMPGPGRFQWNTGGWFGGQIGGTAWMAVLGTGLIEIDRVTAALVLGLALLANAVGFALWLGRYRVPPFWAMEALIGFCGLAGLGVVWLYTRSGIEVTTSAAPTYWFLLLYPALMLLFWVWERASLRVAARSD